MHRYNKVLYDRAQHRKVSLFAKFYQGDFRAQPLSRRATTMLVHATFEARDITSVNALKILRCEWNGLVAVLTTSAERPTGAKKRPCRLLQRERKNVEQKTNQAADKRAINANILQVLTDIKFELS
jgi:hypothetical protein